VRLLLDTHIWLWSVFEPTRLVGRVAKELETDTNELWLSPISTWETLVLMEKGRIVTDDAHSTIDAMLRAGPFREAALTHAVAAESRKIELPHPDPADRFLAATAKVYDLTLVTADERLLESSEFAVFPNR
jgi:PIN domain nuclease of toxin-antitoxin system